MDYKFLETQGAPDERGKPQWEDSLSFEFQSKSSAMECAITILNALRYCDEDEPIVLYFHGESRNGNKLDNVEE